MLAGDKGGPVGGMATPVVKYTVVVHLVEEGTASLVAGGRVTPAVAAAVVAHSQAGGPNTRIHPEVAEIA